MFMVRQIMRNSDAKVRDRIFTGKVNVIYMIGEINISKTEDVYWKLPQ